MSSNKKFISFILSLVLLSACFSSEEEIAERDQESHNEQAGTRLSCKEESQAWLSDQKLLGPWKAKLESISAGSQSSPFFIEEGQAYRVQAREQREEDKSPVRDILPLIQDLGYQGSYGGHLQITPKQSGIYRIAGDKAWYHVSVGDQDIKAAFYLEDCLDSDVYKVVEFPLEAGIEHTIQIVNADSSSVKVLVYSPY